VAVKQKKKTAPRPGPPTSNPSHECDKIFPLHPKAVRPMELPSVYNPEAVDSKWYPVWEQQGLFHATPDPKRTPFVIVIPPPNVTGSLHMGHALNNTLQDLLIRWRRMKGDNTLWLPGTDHGGIATQNVVEKQLKAEGKTRHDLGRRAFLERMWKWRQESGDTILMQLKKLGCALDWSRTRFTMDAFSSAAVLKAFVEFYRDGLLYRGYRLVNWCPRCQTALSDIEVEYVETRGKLWQIRYPFKDGGSAPDRDQYARSGTAEEDPPAKPGAPAAVIVATTRPETMLGDTAVAVNPEDERYKSFIGRRLVLPLMNREIPLVADAAVDSAFGTGAVKVTPSHDQTDFDIAARHNLPHEMVIGFDGRMTERAGKFAGQTVKDARKNVLAELEAGGFLVKEEDYKHSVATCYRCATVIEPLESSQWFLKTKDVAGAAARATEKGEVKIFPSSWEKPYLNWLNNNRDWCVSRQIWWGHQIPVWYCPDCGGYTDEQKQKIKADPEFQKEETKLALRQGTGEPFVQESAPRACPRCGGAGLLQDPDVLDTWFSSGLWPLTTLGWPQENPDLAYFYPTTVLATGHEILYLWVARMVMMGLYFRKQVPYRHVFIHGIVRDKGGRKMSKSLNNVIDPLDIIKKFGTDALRFAIVSQAVPGRDMQMAEENFTAARNFANKMWNASRFVLTNLAGHTPADIPVEKRDLADRWILHRFADVRSETEGFLAQYDMAQAARALRAFFWDDFCDWYIELAKIRLQGEGAAPEARRAAQQTLADVLEGILRAFHPIMPFITEELWHALGETLGQKRPGSLMTQDYLSPLPDLSGVLPADLKAMGFLMETVTAVRTIRSEMNVPLGKTVDMIASFQTESSENRQSLSRHGDYVKRLAKVSNLQLVTNGRRPPQAATAVVADAEFYVPVGDLIDRPKEKQRLLKEISALEADEKRLAERLGNPDFIQRAPTEEIEKARSRAAEVAAKLKRLRDHLQALDD